MGLSNEERYEKIVWSVKKLEDLIEGLRDEYGYEKLKSFSGKLWPALLNKSGDSGFWLFGGGFTTPCFEKVDLVSIALKTHVEDLKEVDTLFEMEENYISNNLNIIQIMNGGNLANVVEIWQWTENFFYAVNRYDDEMSKSLVDIKTVVSQLKGELFNVITTEPYLLDGYLLYHILETCINPYSDEILTKMIDDMGFYHNFRLSEELDSKLLMDVWKDIQHKTLNDLSEQNRILIVLRCLGRRIVKDIPKIKEYLKDHVDENLLEQTLEQCQSDQNAYDECRKNYRREKYCTLTWDWNEY